jgi:hypothetical protein
MEKFVGLEKAGKPFAFGNITQGKPIGVINILTDLRFVFI